MTALEQLAQSYLDLKWQLDPVAATEAGRSEHDGRLGRFGVEDVRRSLAALRSLDGALEECAVDSLDEEVDRTALLNDVRVMGQVLKREQPHRRNPAFWLEHVFDGLYLMLAARDRTRDHRVAAAAERLQAVPEFLELAAETLEGCHPVFLETAQDQIDGGAGLIDQLAAEFAPDGGEAFRVACGKAKEALTTFATHLGAMQSEDGKAKFAIGEDAFNFRLHYEHALKANAAELWRYGHALVDEVEVRLGELANEFEPGASWHGLVDRLRGEHPPADQLVAAYREGMSRSRRFVEENDIAVIPPGDLAVIDTPTFLRPLVPFAAYQPPGAFSTDRTGWFYVTSPGSDIDAATAERQLRDHCVHELAATALHEGYPGHHLQFLHAHQQVSDVRKVVGSALTIEGWALYCEEMMGEEGFYRTPEERLFQLVALLWRAMRVIVDVGLHTRGMSYREAVDLLVDRLHFDVGHAEAEVRRYCAHPAYQLCYAAGRREMLSLRGAYRAAAGAEYSLKRFHEAVLRFGGLPVSLMRWGLGLDE